jgi:hypothetical protein
MYHLQIQFIPGSVLLFIPGMCSILLVNICNEAHLVSWKMAGHHYRSYWRWIQKLHKPPTDSTSCTSHWTSANRESWPGNCHTHPMYFSLMTTHTTQYLLFPTNHLLKLQKKTQLSPNSMVSDLCSVLISGWVHLGIQGWAPFPELRVQGWNVFYDSREVLLYCIPTISESSVFGCL